MTDVKMRICTSARHKNSKSGFSQDKVPIEYFRKKNKPDTDLYNTCTFCRGSHDKVRNERIRQSEELQQLNPDFGVCCCDSHDVSGVSIFPRNMVPIALFIMGKQKSHDCSNCRSYQSTQKKEARIQKKTIAQEINTCCCTSCFKNFDPSEMGTNLNGTRSSTCKLCKEVSNNNCKKTSAHLRFVARSIRLEKIREDGCSCNKCKKIFLKPLPGDNHQRTLETYEKDGKRYIDFEGVTYSTNTFLEKFAKDLELRTIDFDHLPEDEQRSRNIIKPEEPFREKRGLVSNMSNEFEMRKEGEIVQNLCCYCHVVVTIEREIYDRNYSPRYREKDAYVKSLKCKGCSFCGFKDDSVARYFEFDHIDPAEKEHLISIMVRKSKFTLDDLIMECLKCRVLCKACHRIRTQIQLGVKEEHNFVNQEIIPEEDENLLDIGENN